MNDHDPGFGNLIWPKSLVTTSNDEIICVDSFEHRLLVFNKDFIYKSQIGSRGNEKGQFNFPVDLALSESSRLYIADKDNSRIQVFREVKKYKQMRVHIARLLASDSDNKKANARPKSFTDGSEFVFDEEIRFKDKPVRVNISPLASTTAIGTESGFIFVMNEKHQITSFIKLNDPTKYNFCLNDMGSELILVGGGCMKFYKIDGSEPTEEFDLNDASFITSSFNNSNKDTVTDSSLIKKLNMTNKVKLQTTYLPGITLTKVGPIKISLDLRNILIYDAINLNLLEFDFYGSFRRIVLRAENYMGNVLAFDFSSDRQHLVTAELELTERNVDFSEPTLIEQFEKNIKLSQEEEYVLAQKKRSQLFKFKFKTLRYMDCACHRHLCGKRKLTARSRSSANSGNAKSNNPSSFSFYNDSFNL